MRSHRPGGVWLRPWPGDQMAARAPRAHPGRTWKKRNPWHGPRCPSAARKQAVFPKRISVFPHHLIDPAHKPIKAVSMSQRYNEGTRCREVSNFAERRWRPTSARTPTRASQRFGFSGLWCFNHHYKHRIETLTITCSSRLTHLPI